MARDGIPDAVKAKLYAIENTEVFLLLLDLSEASWPAPLRLVHNTEPITHNGNAYQPMYFEVGFPSDSAENIGSASIRIDNISREVGNAIRVAIGRPSVSIQLVSSLDWDDVLAGPWEFDIEKVDVDSMSVTATAVAPEGLLSAYPSQMRTPTTLPEVF